MSYEMMEALLVQKIAALRESEATFSRSLRSAGDELRAPDLHTIQDRMNVEINEVEHLLSLMDAAAVSDAASIPAMAVIESSTRVTPSVWV
jgi:hypothetical protein